MAVSVNVAVRDLDIGVPNEADARRLEVVVDGLPLFHEAQLGVDTTLVDGGSRDGALRSGVRIFLLPVMCFFLSAVSSQKNESSLEDTKLGLLGLFSRLEDQSKRPWLDVAHRKRNAHV